MARGTGPRKAETKKGQKPTTEADEATETAEAEVPEETEEEAPEASEEPEEDEVPEETVAAEAQPTADRGLAKQADPKIHQRQKKEMADIIIDETRTEAEQQDVFVTDPSDGTPFQIQRGKEVPVPIGVLNNLRESVQEKLVRNKTTGAEEWKKVPRFSFTVLREYTK